MEKAALSIRPEVEEPPKSPPSIEIMLRSEQTAVCGSACCLEGMLGVGMRVSCALVSCAILH